MGCGPDSGQSQHPAGLIDGGVGAAYSVQAPVALGGHGNSPSLLVGVVGPVASASGCMRRSRGGAGIRKQSCPAVLCQRGDLRAAIELQPPDHMRQPI